MVIRLAFVAPLRPTGSSLASEQFQEWTLRAALDDLIEFVGLMSVATLLADDDV